MVVVCMQSLLLECSLQWNFITLQVHTNYTVIYMKNCSLVQIRLKDLKEAFVTLSNSTRILLNRFIIQEVGTTIFFLFPNQTI